jgi:hypothetical protein
LARKQQFDATYAGSVSEVFAALGQTLSFRRWIITAEPLSGPVPAPGYRYRCQAGSVLRVGRVVDVIRPIGVTLKEVLNDPPCRVSLTMRWRVEPIVSGCSVHLRVRYRLNHAAVLVARHWERRLQLHFRNQLAFLAVNLYRIQEQRSVERPGSEKRDLSHY